MARSESGRPGYRRLIIAVPQRGDMTVPEVLLRFKTAMNGMGTIRLEAHNLYQWRVTDHSQARATIALLRPWIGPVKRGQAARALAAVDTQYALGRVRGRPGRRRSPIIIPPVRRGILGSVARRRLDRAWAAGFLDAVGCFGLARARPRVGGLPWYRIRASAAQHGESAHPRSCFAACTASSPSAASNATANRMTTSGCPRVFLLCSAFSKSLARGLAASNGNRRDMRSPRRCNACRRLLDRRKRAALGIAPRPFKDLARRYTE